MRPHCPDAGPDVRDNASVMIASEGRPWDHDQVQKMAENREIIHPLPPGRIADQDGRMQALHGSNGRLPLAADIGMVTRPYPGMVQNGDCAVIHRGADGRVLIGVIDGIGHGYFAQIASQKARQYVERHADQPLADLLRGVNSVCRSTRGVVMSLIRADQPAGRLEFMGVGNVECRILNAASAVHLLPRRGMLGKQLPPLVLQHHEWAAGSLVILFTDGVSGQWAPDVYHRSAGRSAQWIAAHLITVYGRHEGDATCVVMASRKTPIQPVAGHQ